MDASVKQHAKSMPSHVSWKSAYMEVMLNVQFNSPVGLTDYCSSHICRICFCFMYFSKLDAGPVSSKLCVLIQTRKCKRWSKNGTVFQSSWKTYHVVQPLPWFLWRSHLWTVQMTRSILDIFPLVFLHLVNIVHVHRLMSQMPRCTFQFKEAGLEEWFKREIECPDSRPNVDKQVGCSADKYQSLQLVGQPRSQYLHTTQYYPTPSIPSTQYWCTIKAFSLFTTLAISTISGR